ncbi:MAG: transcriptional regulator NrdR [Patescibacteria group bacterium]
MKCPYCATLESKVVDSRDTEEGSVRRRRECEKCGKRFTTYEKVENIKLSVIKKDGRSEEYAREKLKKGMMLAIEKRPVTEEQIESVIDDIESKLLNRKTTEVSSANIGQMALTRLKKLDKVAYLRYASVFLEFQGLEDFKKEIGQF